MLWQSHRTLRANYSSKQIILLTVKKMFGVEDLPGQFFEKQQVVDTLIISWPDRQTGQDKNLLVYNLKKTK